MIYLILNDNNFKLFVSKWLFFLNFKMILVTLFSNKLTILNILKYTDCDIKMRKIGPVKSSFFGEFISKVLRFKMYTLFPKRYAIILQSPQIRQY